MARTVFRTSAFGALFAGAYFGIGRLSRRPELLTLVGGSLAISYLAGYLPVGWPVSPHRFVLGAGFAAALAAADVLARLVTVDALRREPWAVRFVALLAALVLVPRIGRTVLSFVPQARPERVIRSPADLRTSALVAVHEPLPERLALSGVSGADVETARWLLRHGGAGGRVLVDDPSLAATLVLTTSIPVVGPLAELGYPYRSDDWFSRPASLQRPAMLDEYLSRYGITLVVTRAESSGPATRPDLFYPPVDMPGFRVWRVMRPTTLIADGEGVISDMRPGGLKLRDVQGDRLVLRLRYDDRLVCRPGCRIESTPDGRITIPSPPRQLEIVDSRKS